MLRLFVSTLAFLALAAPAQAAVSYRWTPAQAAARVKATYTDVDTVRLADAMEKLQRDLDGGLPETDPRVVRDRQYIADAKVGAVPSTVKCVGVGKPVKRRFSKFHCTVQLRGTAEWTNDGFSATKKLTVRLPFRVLAGWV